MDNLCGNLTTDYSEESLIAHFWKKVQDEVGNRVPQYLKNISKSNNLDNAFAMRDFDDNVIAELETFSKTTMLQILQEEQVDLQEYYGRFYKNPENFRRICRFSAIWEQCFDFSSIARVFLTQRVLSIHFYARLGLSYRKHKTLCTNLHPVKVLTNLYW